MLTCGPFFTRQAAESCASSYEERGYSCEIIATTRLISGPFWLRCSLATPDPLLKPRRPARRTKR